MDVATMLQRINTTHGTTFRLVAERRGGVEGPLFELIDAAGQRAVLKRSPTAG